MTNTNPKIDLVDIVYEVTKSLCMLYRSATKRTEHYNYMDRQTISIPNYRSKTKKDDSESQKEASKPRVSEQELRFVLAAELQMRGIRYSVETPTEEKYTFTKRDENEATEYQGRSAQTDLTILNQYLDPVLNVELKHGGYSINRNSGERAPLPIRKDIEKLLKERVSGCYIHLFSAVNSNSARNIVDCIKESATELTSEKTKLNSIGQAKEAYVYIFIISLTQKCFIYARKRKSELWKLEPPTNTVKGDCLTSTSKHWKLIDVTMPPRDIDFVLELPAGRSNCDSNSSE